MNMNICINVHGPSHWELTESQSCDGNVAYKELISSRMEHISSLPPCKLTLSCRIDCRIDCFLLEVSGLSSPAVRVRLLRLKPLRHHQDVSVTLGEVRPAGKPFDGFQRVKMTFNRGWPTSSDAETLGVCSLWPLGALVTGNPEGQSSSDQRLNTLQFSPNLFGENC